MSICAEIRDIAYNMLYTEGTCTLEQIRVEMRNRGIPLDGNTAATVRATMSQLIRKDENIKRAGRGYYEYVKSKENLDGGMLTKKEKTMELQEDDMKEMDKLEQKALEVIREVGKFDWINGSDEDVDRIRKKIKRLKELNKTLKKECAEYHISLN